MKIDTNFLILNRNFICIGWSEIKSAVNLLHLLLPIKPILKVNLRSKVIIMKCIYFLDMLQILVTLKPGLYEPQYLLAIILKYIFNTQFFVMDLKVKIHDPNLCYGFASVKTLACIYLLKVNNRNTLLVNLA